MLGHLVQLTSWHDKQACSADLAPNVLILPLLFLGHAVDLLLSRHIACFIEVSLLAWFRVWLLTNDIQLLGLLPSILVPFLTHSLHPTCSLSGPLSLAFSLIIPDRINPPCTFRLYLQDYLPHPSSHLPSIWYSFAITIHPLSLTYSFLPSGTDS